MLVAAADPTAMGLSDRLGDEGIHVHGVHGHRLRLAFHLELSLRLDRNPVSEPALRVHLDQDRPVQADRVHHQGVVAAARRRALKPRRSRTS
jgi:hypothetical protein